MNEREARHALLIRAYETATGPEAQTVWNGADREWASSAALKAEGEAAPPERLVARRAELAWQRLRERDPAAARIDRALHWRGWIGWLAAAIGLLAGLAADAAGASQRVNLLAPPLMALIAWNLAVYALLLVRSRRIATSHRGPLARLASLMTGGARALARANPGSALSVFLRDWVRASGTLGAARVARVMHVAAATLALGAVAGLYLRGLAFEFRAGWESTFLEAGTVHALLSVVLGPAAALTGIELPEIERLAALRFPASAGENAAPWIHLWATTVALVVLAPRAILAGLSLRQERQLCDQLPLALDDVYFQSLLRAARREAARALVVPYSVHPSAAALNGLRTLLGTALGAATEAETSRSVDYGNEDEFVLALTEEEPPALVAALFSFAATPEAESHGVFARAVARQAAGQAPVLALVDESSFRRRFGDGDQARHATRREAWRRLLGDCGLEALCVDLEQQPRPTDVEALRAALDRIRGYGART